MCYLDDGAGKAWAGHVRDREESCSSDTRPIIAVENLGREVPIGSKLRTIKIGFLHLNVA